MHLRLRPDRVVTVRERTRVCVLTQDRHWLGCSSWEWGGWEGV